MIPRRFSFQSMVHSGSHDTTWICHIGKSHTGARSIRFLWRSENFIPDSRNLATVSCKQRATTLLGRSVARLLKQWSSNMDIPSSTPSSGSDHRLGFFQVSSAALVQSQLICLQLGFLKSAVFCCYLYIISILLLSTYSSNEILFRIFRLPKLLQLGCSLLRSNRLECYEAFRVTSQKWWRRQTRLWLRLNKR